MAREKSRTADRIDAQPGPDTRTQPGKSAVRVKVISYGPEIRNMEVLPNEDPQEFQARIDAWFEIYQPNNLVEELFVRQAVIFSWKLDRTMRYEKAVCATWIRDAIKEAEKVRIDRMYGAMRQLLPSATQVEKAGYGGDPASMLVLMLQESAAGCRWLIHHWWKLRDSLRDDQFWSAECEMHAIRLSGLGPGLIEDPELIEMIVANRVLRNPENRVDPSRRLEGTLGMSFNPVAARMALLSQATNPVEAKAVLLAGADRQIAKLEALLDVRERDGNPRVESVDAAAWSASFEPTIEAKRLRRYQATLKREIQRILDSLTRSRAQKAKAARILAKEANSGFAGKGKVTSPPKLRAVPKAHHESPAVLTFEEFFRCRIPANEANFVDLVQISSGIDAKRQVEAKPDFRMDDIEAAERLKISHKTD